MTALRSSDFEFLRVVEFLVHGIGERGILMKDFEIELIGPPRGVGWAAGDGMFARTASAGERALCFGGIAGDLLLRLLRNRWPWFLLL